MKDPKAEGAANGLAWGAAGRLPRALSAGLIGTTLAVLWLGQHLFAVEKRLAGVEADLAALEASRARRAPARRLGPRAPESFAPDVTEESAARPSALSPRPVVKAHPLMPGAGVERGGRGARRRAGDGASRSGGL